MPGGHSAWEGAGHQSLRAPTSSVPQKFFIAPQSPGAMASPRFGGRARRVCPVSSPQPLTRIKILPYRFPRGRGVPAHSSLPGAGTDAIIRVTGCPQPAASGRSTRRRLQDASRSWGGGACRFVPRASQTRSGTPVTVLQHLVEGGEAPGGWQRRRGPPIRPEAKLDSDGVPDIAWGRAGPSGPQQTAGSGARGCEDRGSLTPSRAPALPRCLRLALPSPTRPPHARVRGSELSTQGGDLSAVTPDDRSPSH